MKSHKKHVLSITFVSVWFRFRLCFLAVAGVCTDNLGICLFCCLSHITTLTFSHLLAIAHPLFCSPLFPQDVLTRSGPAVLFAAPGMLHGGLSLEAFLRWAPDPNNLVILPGYCSPGTVGHRILNGEDSIEVFGMDEPVR